MLGSWGWEEELELGEGTTAPSHERQRRESPDSTHPVPDSRVLRYAPSRCHHPPSYSSPHFSTQPPLDCTDCEYIFRGSSRALVSARERRYQYGGGGVYKSQFPFQRFFAQRILPQAPSTGYDPLHSVWFERFERELFSTF